MNYNQYVETYFFGPEHVATDDKITANMIYYRAGQPEHEAFIDLYVAVSGERAVLAAYFKAYGSPYLIAGGEWLCRYLSNKVDTGTSSFDYHYLVHHLDIPTSQYPLALLLEQAYRGIMTAINQEGRYHE